MDNTVAWTGRLKTDMAKWIALAAGSLAGGFSRYALAEFMHGLFGRNFPLGTLAVNVTGCFLIGLLNGLGEGRFSIGPNTRIMLITGFCGAYTTFSTLMLETSGLLKGGQTWHAFLNVGLSLLLGLALFLAGEYAGKLI